MRVLVLGSAGVVGQGVVKNLRARGDDVIEWDLMLSSNHDLRIRGILNETFAEGVDFVVFLAFDVGGSKYPVTSAQYISNNMRLLENTFESLAKFKVPFIHSTSQMSNMDHNPYGPLKRIGEFYTEYLGGINVKIWNVYGHEEPGPKSHVLPDFVDQALTTKKIQMLTTGAERRQFLHTADFARVIAHLIDNYENFKTKIVDVSNFEWVSILDVAHMVADVCGPGVEVVPGIHETSFQTKVNEPKPSGIPLTPSITLRDGIEKLKAEFTS
jgi:nucleoside-diphosphate-sugar epimerase